jgi:two-component system NtrC family sensor kinase
VRRSLRVQAIVIVVAAVAGILTLSHALNAALSDSLFDRDLHERGLLAARVVESLWDGGDWGVLSALLAALVGNHRDILAVDVFDVAEGAPRLLSTTRSAEAVHPPSDAALRELSRGKEVDAIASGGDGERLRRLEVPIRRDERLVGVVETDVSFTALSVLRRELREIDLAMLGASILILSLTITGFFRRRVNRPVALLLDGMRQAEAGVRGARVPAQRTAEFDELASAFNRMLARLEEASASLESRVRQATRDLAERNRELRDANERLGRAQLEAAQSERFAALGQLAATLAHDLGTPLNAVLGYTQLLRRAPLAPEHASKVAIVEAQVRRMVETIRGLLDRTRRGAPRHGAVAVPALVGEALEIVAARLDAIGAQARSEIEPELPVLQADAIGLRQALVNLLTNAIDASPPGSTITVRARRRAPSGNPTLIEIAVADQGTGIPRERLPHVFEPFYTTKPTGCGTGLGLAIVRRIVAAHGGRVDVESAPECGSTFTLVLPVRSR